MSRLKNENTDDVGKFAVMIAFICGIGVWIEQPGIFSSALLLLSLMGVATVGMWLSWQSKRRDLERLRKDELERGLDISFLEGELEACRLRTEKREKVRAGLEVDNGLSDWGRELAGNKDLGKWIEAIEEEFGPGLPSKSEDIFKVEAQDKRLLVAWQKKVAAEELWNKTWINRK